MEYRKIDLPALNSYASDYIKGKIKDEKFIQYNWLNEDDIKERVEWLESRSYPRKEISAYIESFMDKFRISDESYKNIKALREGALVVIGGQQAGLLTGPLYSIHKVISVVKLAKEQTEKLGKTVVPVFWIAGEDHDYQEVNHVYTTTESGMQKNIYPEKQLSKKIVSDITIDHQIAKEWIEEIFTELGETDRSNLLIEWLDHAIEQSMTITDFFAFLINDLFNDTGLLMVDSGDPEFRKLAKPYYQLFAKESKEISSAVLSQQKLLRQKGYKPIIDINQECANLFYYDDDNRILLEREKDTDYIVGKSGGIRLTGGDLEELISTRPECICTNVVSRPLLQEKMFPVLGFIAGPGEIAYWSEIKPAFNLLGEKMPPIWPRLSFTLLEGSILRLMNEFGLDLEDVLRKGCLNERDSFIEQLHERIPDDYQQIKEQLLESHKDWEAKIQETDKGLQPLFEKNRQLILDQLEFLQKKIEIQVERRHQETIAKYNRIENMIHPFGGLQERIWHPFYFFNQYGASWIDELLKEPFEYNGTHYVVYI